jgi:hypothetical protein
MRREGVVGRRWRRLGLLSLFGLFLGCSRFDLDLGSDEQTPVRSDARPQLWTLFDMQAAMAANRPVAPTASFPDGFPADTFITPQPDGAATLRIIPAYSEGEPAAYVLPEIWLNFDEIWVQPWYEFVTAWNDRSNTQNALKGPDGQDAPPVWDVSHRSLFYSPFWVVFYAVVPPGTAYDHYTSVEQIVNDGLPIYRGPPWIYSVRPPNVGLGPKPLHPYLEKEVATALREFPISYVDHEPVPYFDEGFNNFEYDQATQVVEEVPMFLLARRDADGKTVFLDAPHVIGSAPLFVRRPLAVYNGKPRFGSLTRFHIANVPATAAPFDPDVHIAGAAALVAKGLDPRAYRGRVARNGIKVAERDRPCFELPEFPTGCVWLDSQARIEDAGGVASIRRTELVACSPVVFYGGKGIGR